MRNGAEPDGRPDPRRSLERDVGRRARREPGDDTFWRSLSVLGVVGWSIAVPAALGAWIGHRVDVRLGTGVRFTLILLTLGVGAGSLVAWRLVRAHRS